MDKNEIVKTFGNRKWNYLLEYKEMEDYVKEYQNADTVENVLKFIDYFVRETKKHTSTFDLIDILALSKKDARSLIWNTCQSIMEWDRSNRIASQAKTWITQFYQFNTEKTIVWKRRHRINIKTIRINRHVPTHKEVFLICDKCYNLRDRSIVLLIYNTGLAPKAICNLKVKDVRGILEQYIEDKELPLTLRIDAEILPKRFVSNAKTTWMPSLIDRDCANLLLRYYEKYRKDANDSEPFYINRFGDSLNSDRLSRQIKSAMDRASEIKPELKESYTYLLRDSFFNRLVAGDMKDIYREFLMMHTQGIKEFYFSEKYHRKEIVKQYLKCGFNREDINSLEKIKELEDRTKKVENSMESFKRIRDDAVIQVEETEEDKETEKESKEPKAIVIDIDDLERYAELVNKGYKVTLKNSTHIVMQKD